MEINPDALRRGREFEKRVFGNWISDSDVMYIRYGWPEELDYESSLQREIGVNWRRAELSRELGEVVYDPSNPQTGESRKIWLAVKSYLASQRAEWGRAPLHLYPTVGWNSLDYYYGVDAVFWWCGVSVTIDVATFKTERKENLKADFLLTTHELASQRNLSMFGRRVGELLIARKLASNGNCT